MYRYISLFIIIGMCSASVLLTNGEFELALTGGNLYNNNMTPEERARCLRQEADTVLDMIHLKKHCASIGQIVPTGSYFTDLMMYPDIDLYLPPATPKILLNIGMQLIEYDCVKEIVFQKGGPGDLAKGLYLKPKVEYGKWGRLWKIDIWTLPSDIIDNKQKELLELKNRMTPVQRQRILEYKFSILTEQGRTPMFSGIFIYRAVINFGIEDFNEITEYLRKNGINL